jgi:hypothetical protein
MVGGGGGFLTLMARSIRKNASPNIVKSTTADVVVLVAVLPTFIWTVAVGLVIAFSWRGPIR